MRVLVTDHLPVEAIEMLRSRGSVDVMPDLSAAQLVRLVGHYDALIVRSRTHVTGDVIEAAKRLKVIGRAGVGLDNIDVEAATAAGVRVVNAGKASTASVGEHTIGTMIALARGLPQAYSSIKRGSWLRANASGMELCGKQLGIIGLGRTGKDVAAKARAFGMKVVACDPYITPRKATTLNVDLTDLVRLLKNCDLVSIHTPLTNQTRDMITGAELALMKPEAMIVNMARGGIINEFDLARALQERTIAGAAVDVFAEEPPRPDCPLWDCETLIATPHIGGSTHEAKVRGGLCIAQDIIAVLEGRAAKHMVNDVPIQSSVPERLRPLFDLAELLGTIHVQLSGQLQDVFTVSVSEKMADNDLELLKAAVIRGVLKLGYEGYIGIHNAKILARTRELRVFARSSGGMSSHHDVMTLEGSTADQVLRVSGFVEGGIPWLATLDAHVGRFPVIAKWGVISYHYGASTIVDSITRIISNAGIDVLSSCSLASVLDERRLAVLCTGKRVPRYVEQRIAGLGETCSVNVVRFYDHSSGWASREKSAV